MFKLLRSREANAHEGPVYVDHQDRLYFATKPNTPSREASVQLCYWEVATNEIETWKADGRMANGMALSCDKSCLLICEQGNLEHPAGIARHLIKDKSRQSLVTEFEGKPFNSPNKVAELSNGRLLFTDPDYGRRQLFRPSKLSPKQIKEQAFVSPEAFAKTGRPPHSLQPSVYTHHKGKTTRIECSLEQPHGLALSPDQGHVYISDTSADDGVGGFDESRQHDIYRFDLNPQSGTLSKKVHFASIAHGIPDGMACDRAGNVYCATGDGIHVYQENGTEIHHVPIENGAVNLWLEESKGWLFVTTDEEILLYKRG